MFQPYSYAYLPPMSSHNHEPRANNALVPTLPLDQLPGRSAAYSADDMRPDQALIDQCVIATTAHPLAIEAMTHSYCHAVVLREPKSFLAQTKFPNLQEVLAALSDSHEVLLVSYHTSTSQPEPLSGHGRTFDFILHPVTFRILHAASGTWRS